MKDGSAGMTAAEAAATEANVADLSDVMCSSKTCSEKRRGEWEDHS